MLFVSAAAAVGVAAIALLERLSDDSRRTVRVMHVLLTAVVFAAFFVVERLYHGVH